MIIDPIIKPASDRSILIQFGSKISEDIHKQIVYYSNILLNSQSSYIHNISPAYCSILVRLKNEVTMEEMLLKLKDIFNNHKAIKATPSKTIKIPVCYEGEFSPDIERVMKYTGYSKNEIITKHISGNYLVYFIGFSPGFPYIGGMDHTLETPRMKTPRTVVPAGSVAIGGNQTGIYPIQSPGGWNIIGRTYLTLFEWENIDDSLIKIGSKIEFCPITKDEFLKFRKSL